MNIPSKPWPTGLAEQCEPLVRRVLAPNASHYTYTGTQTYIVGAGREVAVIDPGPADSGAEGDPSPFKGADTNGQGHVEAILAAVGEARIAAILCTHTHRDHSPAAAVLKARTGAPIIGCAPLVLSDDGPRADSTVEKLASLKPAFREDGTVTAATSSSISDGAAAVVLMRESKAKALGLTPLARIVGHATHAQEPNLFTTAPVGAMQKLFARTGWTAAGVDCYEINEAFAVVTMAAMHDLKLPAEKVNVHGGACALGHPIGASGCRILVTLLGALRKYGGKRGVASLCIGGGEAVAVAVEAL